MPGMGLPVLAPYTVSLPLGGIIGTVGIEVIGANKKKQIAIMSKEEYAQSAAG
jgi:hypothetical protein